MAMKKLPPENWLEICAEEVERGKLTSHPRKYAFMEARGMKSIEEVHAWMIKVRTDFEKMIEELV
jgi:hypothetical protein